MIDETKRLLTTTTDEERIIIFNAIEKAREGLKNKLREVEK